MKHKYNNFIFNVINNFNSVKYFFYDYIATFVAILNIGSKNVYILWVTYYIILSK